MIGWEYGAPGGGIERLLTNVSAAAVETALVEIPAGRVLLGSTPGEVDRCVEMWSDRLVDPGYADSFRHWIEKETPAHTVTVEPFRLARFPVTNAQFRPFADDTGARAESLDAAGDASSADHPVWGLDRATALSYIDWLRSRQPHDDLRLPSEAEWEWAARGPERLEYPFGNDFDPARCNTIEGGPGTTTPVGTYPGGVSPFGVWDMAGNVEEYTADDYAPYPGGSLTVDDLYRDLGPNYPILRGGSCALGGDLARGARRHGPYRGGPAFGFTGFRLAASVQAR